MSSSSYQDLKMALTDEALNYMMFEVSVAASLSRD